MNYETCPFAKPLMLDFKQTELKRCLEMKAVCVCCTRPPSEFCYRPYSYQEQYLYWCTIMDDNVMFIFGSHPLKH